MKTNETSPNSNPILALENESSTADDILRSVLPRSAQFAICNLQSAIKKVRPDDVLGNLPKADQDRILEMLDHRSYRDVLKEINQPAPGGLGLNIQYNSLRKFYLKHLPTRLAEERPDESSDWKVLIEQAGREPLDFRNLIREALEREVYISLRHPDPEDPRPLKLLQCLLRWRGQDLRQSKSSNKSSPAHEASSAEFVNPSIPTPPGCSATPASPTPPATPHPASPKLPTPEGPVPSPDSVDHAEFSVPNSNLEDVDLQIFQKAIANAAAKLHSNLLNPAGIESPASLQTLGIPHLSKVEQLLRNSNCKWLQFKRVTGKPEPSFP